jgi:DNA replication protein DnaC
MKFTDLTDTILLQLKLHGIKASLAARLKQARDEALGIEDFINILLQDEIDYRKNARVARLLKNATLRLPASPESYDWSLPRGLDKRLMNDLASCRFVRDGDNVIVTGPTGVGKSYVASALGNAACRQGHTTHCFRMNTLLEQIALVRAKGTYLNLVKKLGGCDLLVLDDFGIKPLTPQQYQDFYDILDERSEGRATIITTQLPVSNWNEVISDPVTCEAVSDRIASRAVKLQMKGGSYRWLRSRQRDSPAKA